MKNQSRQLLIVATAALVSFFFQNCAGSYSPSEYSNQGSSSPDSAPTPTPSSTPTNQAPTNCVVAANTTWQNSAANLTCAISTATTLANNQALAISSNNGNVGAVTYSCVNGVATAVSGSNSCVAPTVQVAAPVIKTEPASVTVTVGQAISLSVVASGSGLIYQWSKNGASVGANSAQFSIAAAALTDAGSYTVTIMNGGGTVTSTAATVTVNPVPHKWVLLSTNTLPPASYPYDPTCSFGTSTAPSDVRALATYPTPLTSTTCTTVGAYCQDQFYVTGAVLSGNFSVNWNLLECQ